MAGWCRILHQVDQAGSLKQALELLENQSYQLLVVDVMLSDGCGLTLTHGEGPPVIAYTLLGPAEIQARQPGPRLHASVGKHEDPKVLDKALRSLCEPRPSATLPLSSSEQEVLRHLLEGKRLVDVAAEKGISQSSVQSYKHRLFSKLGVGNLRDLLKTAAQKGWLD